MKNLKVKPRSDETLDKLKCGDLYVFQKEKGYRFSLDAYLLAAFVHELPETKVLEIGTGSGVIAIMLAAIKKLKVTGIEVQGEMAEMAKRSVKMNRLQKTIEIIDADIKTLEGLHGFDAVVTNPPYRPIATGRVNPNPNKAIARHEILLDLDTLLKHAYSSLNPGGRLYIIYPAWRLSDLISAMRLHKIEPKRIVPVYSRESEEAVLCLVSGIKDGGKDITFDPPFIIYSGKKYSGQAELVFDNLRITQGN
jgi:tRNA1Val (adenine37-N6)-methyltransferase